MAKNTYSFVVQETRSVSVFNEVLLIAAKLAHGEKQKQVLCFVEEESKLLLFFYRVDFRLSFFLSPPSPKYVDIPVDKSNYC